MKIVKEILLLSSSDHSPHCIPHIGGMSLKRRYNPGYNGNTVKKQWRALSGLFCSQL